MRLMRTITLIVTLLLVMASHRAVAQSSFGPEISVEDYLQHVQNLNASSAGTAKADFSESLGQSYLTYQFVRLGLSTQSIACNGSALYVAKLAGTVPDMPPVVFYAPWQQPTQMAGVLEIAERFLTQRPRPKHAVYFAFSNKSETKNLRCGPFKNATLVLQPDRLENLDPMALVRYLNSLQMQGK